MSRLFIVLTAAGSGTRLGANTPKALVTLGSDSLLAHALHHLPPSNLVVISAPPAYLAGFSQIAAQSASPPPLVVPGGASRQASVLAALEALADVAAPITESDLVLVHDAARPFTPATVFSQVVAALQQGCPAVIPATPVLDTIKVVRSVSTPAREVVTDTLNRSQLRAVQTPQGFPLPTLLELHRRFAARAATETSAFGDDAALAEAAGIPVAVVPGSPRSLKITTPFDLQVAQLLANSDCPEAG